MRYERVVIDDERTHKDGGVHLRTSASWFGFCADHPLDFTIGELWLDHDLGGHDTIRPVVLSLAEAIFEGVPFDIEVIYAHTANPVGADYIISDRLLAGYYDVRRAGLENFVI